MADFDITALILSEHDAFRRAFAELEGQADAAASQHEELAALRTGWQQLADALEVHAAGEEQVFYPHLLQQVTGSEDDTEHAVQDHNEIRDAVRAVDQHELGSDSWWEAFRAAREATVDHLEEEEHDVLPPFKDAVDEGARTELGMAWLAFHDEHESARGLSGSDVDPEAYVEQHG